MTSELIRAQALPVRRREVDVCQGIRLGLLQHGAALGQNPSSMSHAAWYMAATVAASRPRNTCETILPTQRLSCQEVLAHAVVYEADGAALPCGAPEDLAERADEARVGVRDDELHAVNAAVADLLEEGSRES